MKRLILFLFFCLFASLPGWGQQYNFQTISVNDGLPHGQVHDIHQTEDGYIWMATNGGGLSRYNGRNFKTYTTEDGLPNNAIHRIFEDSKQNLWVATKPGGVVTFQGDSLVNPFPDEPISDFEVWDITEIKDGELWFATYNGGIFIRKNNKFTRLTTEEGLISNSVWDIYKSRDGSIWVATETGISVIKGDDITNYTTDNGLSGNRVYSFVEDGEGTIWIATNKGLTMWDGQQFKSLKEISGVLLEYVFDLSIDSNGHLWIGTETKGIFKYDGEEYTRFTRQNGLSSNYVYSLFEDQDGNMWVATNENGASLYKGDAFIFYDENFGLSSGAVLSLLIENQTLWFGTQQGLESYDGQSVKQHSLPKEYENNYIWEIEQLPNGNLLVLMPDDELMEYDGRQFQEFMPEYDLELSIIYDLHIDTEDVLWIASDEGIYRLENGNITSFTIADGLPGNVIYSIYEDETGHLLFGTNSGLSLYDGKIFENITINNGLESNVVRYITTDQIGNIWLGTSSGVSVIETAEQNGQFRISNFGKQDGMPLLDTHFLWFDEMGHLWQGTNGGLNRLDVPRYWETGNMDLMHYPLSDEGLGVEFNFGAVVADSEGNAWFGSMDGALKLDVSKLLAVEKQKPPKTHITDIKRNSEFISWDEYADRLTYNQGQLEYPSITFSPGEHSYTFSFAGLDYNNPDNVQYRFMMEGFEKEWVPLTTANSATYTNLDPGSYTFKVQSVVGGKEKSDSVSTAAYSFTVDYPFWQTYWFYALVFISLVGMVIGFLKIRLGMFEKQQLQKLVDEQTKDLTKALEEKEVLIQEIHHRVKNNLAVISGLLQMQLWEASDERTKSALQQSNLRVRSIALVHEKLYQLETLSYIRFDRYISELIEVIGGTYQTGNPNIKIETDLADLTLTVNQAIPCALLINESIINAFKYAFEDGANGIINVTIGRSNGRVRVQVSDNGKGLQNLANDSDSLGLTLVETLAKQLDGDLSTHSDNGAHIEIQFIPEKYR